MINFLKKQWFFVGIAIVVVLAFCVPALGIFVEEYNILKIGIFLSFLVTGMTLNTSEVCRQLKRYKVLCAAVFSSLIFFPVVVYYLASVVLDHHPDFVIGALIIAAAPVTVASGTVMTNIAKGNVSLSLFICVLCNVLGVFTIAPVLNFLISTGHDIELPIAKMMIDLAFTVLIPTIIGQLLQQQVAEIVKTHKKKLSIFNQSVVLLIIFNAVAGSTDKLVAAGNSILYAFAFMIVVHNLYLVFNNILAKGIGLDRADRTAFTIHTSQKTLAVSYLVWAGYFADTYPMALIPGIAYHLTQSICDTILAERWRKKADLAGEE